MIGIEWVRAAGRGRFSARKMQVFRVDASTRLIPRLLQLLILPFGAAPPERIDHSGQSTAPGLFDALRRSSADERTGIALAGTQLPPAARRGVNSPVATPCAIT